MNVKEMKKVLENYEDDREVVLWDWDDSRKEPSLFYSLVLTATPTANSKNMLVFNGVGLIKPTRE